MTIFPPQPVKLTPREMQIIDMITCDMNFKEIAQALGIKPGTVRLHLSHARQKYHVNQTTTLVFLVTLNKMLASQERYAVVI